MIDRTPMAQSYISRVRGIPLLPGERLTRVFSLRNGLLDEPSFDGDLLIATNQRILFFRNEGKHREVSLFPLDEFTGAAIRSRNRRGLAVLSGIGILVAGLLAYLSTAYWLAGRLNGPSIPILEMDLAPFVLLALTMVVSLTYWRRNVLVPVGDITLWGRNWVLSFVCHTQAQVPQLQLVVDALYASRRPSLPGREA